MALQEHMFRDSIWSRDDTRISQLGRLPVPWNNTHRGGTSAPEAVSRFSSDSDDDSPQFKMSSLRETLFVATICIAYLCAQAGIGQTLPIMRNVGSRFRVTNADNLSSAIAGYDVALGTFILVAGRLGEIFGHKRIFIIGLVWSAVWSVVTGASFYSTRSLFILSQIFQGVGAGLTLPTGLALLTATGPTGIRKTIRFTLYSIMSPVGLIVGALGAGIFMKLAWWPWIYWVFSITLVVLAAVGCSAIPSIPQASRRQLDASEVISELDVPGMVAGIASFGLFAFVWSQAQEVGWQQVYLWIILIISVLLAVLFVMIEICYARRPLIPFSDLSSEVFWILVIVGCSWACFGVWMFYSWQFVGRLRSASPLLSTAFFVPMILVGGVTAVSTHFISRRAGQYVTFCAALLAMMTSGVLTATMPIAQTYWEQFFMSILLMAWGLYTSVPIGATIISDAVYKKHGNIAAGLVSTMTYYGMGLGLGVAGTANTRIIATGGGLTVYNRLRGYRIAYWMSVSLAGFGFVVCLALALASSHNARRPR
ncbi:major facilitator superfamily transporter [Xylaria intraflava]|nr:major facilitator superfamily transporter [Xylaria intraflava]